MEDNYTQPCAKETKARRGALMAWRRKARFGMFIHWGPPAIYEGYYKGKPSRIGEQSSNMHKSDARHLPNLLLAWDATSPTALS